MTDDARFCPGCGTAVPPETPAAIDAYRSALATLAGRVGEAWADDELRSLRVELAVREGTHARLLAELAPRVTAPISAEVDARSIRDFRAGEQCLLRFRVANEGPRPIATIELRVATGGEALRAVSDGVVAPGEHAVLSVWFRPPIAGHHRAEVGIDLVSLRGGRDRWRLDEIPYLVAAPTLAQQIHIDARSQRVGIFENIGGAAKGGLVGEAEWRRVEVRTAAPAPVEAAASGGAVGTTGVGVVLEAGDPALVALGDLTGRLVDVERAVGAVLRPGDRLQVTVLGHDAHGRPLLSARAGAAELSAPPGSDGVIGPDDDLAAALRAAVPGSTLRLSGTHRGPVVLDRPVELVGGVITGETGPVVRIAADVVLRDVVVRGDAPAGAYAADGIEVRSGRVVLDGCTVSADAPGNLVPGRAVAVSGSATVELRGCTLQGSGIGVAVDVSWSGFATDTARGARVRVVDCELAGVATGVAIAGADREVRIVRSRFAGVEAAGRVGRGATCGVEDCAVPQRLWVAEAGANLIVRGKTP
ncbi:MAG: hypothetical protein ABMB14_16350 [Myxococcota bacterium]